jgi:hypothetical protein
MNTTETPVTAGAAPAGKKATVRKAARKPAAKKGKALVKASSKQVRKATAPVKPAKLKKLKLVRDSYTMPKEEHTVLTELKQRCAKLGHPSKKSELLRAGVKALAAMSDKTLLAALKAVPILKTGRPKQT